MFDFTFFLILDFVIRMLYFRFYVLICVFVFFYFGFCNFDFGFWYVYMHVLYVYLRPSPAEEVCFDHNLVGGGRVGVDFRRDFWASYTHMYKAHTSKIRHCSPVSRSMDAEGCGFADIPLHPCNRLSVFPSVECRPRHFLTTAQ